MATAGGPRANRRTYLIERKEAHSLHREKGIHGRNYSDLPLWNIVSGSFLKPEGFEGEVGFEPQAARRIGAMLVGIDVNGSGASAPDAHAGQAAPAR